MICSIDYLSTALVNYSWHPLIMYGMHYLFMAFGDYLLDLISCIAPESRWAPEDAQRAPMTTPHAPHGSQEPKEAPK